MTCWSYLPLNIYSLHVHIVLFKLIFFCVSVPTAQMFFLASKLKQTNKTSQVHNVLVLFYFKWLPFSAIEIREWRIFFVFNWKEMGTHISMNIRNFIFIHPLTYSVCRRLIAINMKAEKHEKKVEWNKLMALQYLFLCMSPGLVVNCIQTPHSCSRRWCYLIWWG